MNMGITFRFIWELFIAAFPPVWVIIAIILTTAANKIANKIGEKKRMLLIADKTIAQDNESLLAKNKELTKQHRDDKIIIDELSSKVTALELEVTEIVAMAKGCIEICKK